MARPKSIPSPQVRLMARVEVQPNGCWLWGGSTAGGNGYGRLRIDYRSVLVHRLSYELHVGSIPEGWQIDHLCHTPECPERSECPHRRCVNPEHLEAVTGTENSRRSGLVQTFPHEERKGHPYNAAIRTVNGRPTRVCRTCSNAAAATYRARQRELLILAGRCADQNTAGALIEAAVAVSRRRVV
jgi:hypothetical protein